MLGSCQSEYERQLTKAKELAKHELRLKQTLLVEENINNQTVEALSSLQEDIAFCAHLSGNQSLFMNEIAEYKSTIKVKSIDPSLMIAKYP